MRQPPEEAKFAVIAKNEEGQWFTLAFGRDEKHAEENGGNAHRNLAMVNYIPVGSRIVEKKIIPIEEWRVRSEHQPDS